MKNIVKFIRWFYPGMKIKRWCIFLVSGLLIILIFSRYRASCPGSRILFYLAYACGIGLLLSGICGLLRSFFEAVNPHKEKGLVDIIYEKRFLAKGPRIVAIGGGTGLSTLLSGLKSYTSNITAIVAVADEGGSSGRLREEFDILPPGDIRNCLVSLAAAPQLMRDLFQYRFTEGEGIKGHSFGNLFITAMTQVSGSFKDAVEESSKVLAIQGQVLPSSLEKIRLRAEYTDGSVKEGEDKIPKEQKPIKQLSLVPQEAHANPQAIEAIKGAELIVFGPGSLYTSILPNLLIKKLADTITSRKDILKLYVCNVMTQPGETDGFTAFDHMNVLRAHVGKNIMNAVLVNSGRMDHALLYKYSQQRSFTVIPDFSRIKEIGLPVYESDVVSRNNYLRHDSTKTARAIINVYNLFRKRCRK